MAKGGGGSNTFKQTPDNLRSEDTFEGVLGLCIGPIKGPTHGLKSIKLDGTAVENASGELNFKDFIVTTADGDPVKHPQNVTLKLGAGAAPSSVNVALTNTNVAAGTGSPGPWITRTLSNTGPNFIDLRFIVSQLYRQDKKGIYNETMSLEIQMKPSALSTWINPILNTPSGGYSESGITIDEGYGNYTTYVPRAYYNGAGTAWLPGPTNYVINGKTSSPSVYELRIAVPNAGAYTATTWDIRVRLLERASYDNGSSTDNIQEKRTVAWESMAAVSSGLLGGHEDWRGVAWAQLYGKASDSLSGVPEITGEYDTKLVKVPPGTVFNPTTRVYTATVWDGSWTTAFTTDPAWIINDAISDSLSGLALLAPGSYLNKWDALEASKWCSELVSDGDGGTHPRYSMNIAINEPQKAEEFVRYLAGAVGGLAWDDGNGQWRMKIDKPETPVDIFTLDNIEGEFAYSHTDVDTRYNDIVGKFKNAEMDYREDAVHLYDSPSIALIGRKPTTIALVGCTNRQEAMRRVKLRLRSAVNEHRIVNFTTNRRGRNIEPLNTILVADGDLGDSAQRTTGRVVTVAPDRLSITVRDTMRLELGVAYTLKFALPNPAYGPEPAVQPTSIDWKNPTTVLARTVTNTAGQRGNVTTIYLATALPATTSEFLTVALEATGLVTLPKAYRVLDVIYDEDNERVGLSAIEIDTGKWTASDTITPEDMSFVDLRGVPSPPLRVTGSATMISLLAVPAAHGLNVNLMANWMRPAGANIAGFRVRYKVNGGNWVTGLEATQFTDFELVNPPPGIYEFEVCTLDRSGKISEPLTDTLEVTPEMIATIAATYSDGTPIDALRPATIGATKNVNRGNWAAGVAYAVGDFFVYNGSSYITDVAHTSSGGSPPPNANVSLFTSAAKAIDVEVDLRGVNYDAAGAIVAGQTANFVINKQNLTSTTVIVRIWRINAGGTYTQLDAGTMMSSGGGLVDNVPDANSFTQTASTLVMSNAHLNSAISTGLGFYIEVSHAVDGVMGRVTVNKVQAGVAGGAGSPGAAAYSVNLLPETLQIASYANGDIANWTGASTTMTILQGTTDVSSSFTVTEQADPQVITTGIVGRTATFTGAGTASGNFGHTGTDRAEVTLRATGSGAHAGVIIDKKITLTKLKGGYEIVGALPGTNLFEGRVVYLTTDDKLYRYVTGTGWTSAVSGADITGGTIPAAAFASTIQPVGIVSSVPGAWNGLAELYNQTDGRMYKWNGSAGAYQRDVDTYDTIPAVKVGAGITDAQINAIAAAKITGQVTTTQISDNSISTPKLIANSVSTDKMVISSGNLVANGSFEYGSIVNWRPYNSPSNFAALTFTNKWYGYFFNAGGAPLSVSAFAAAKAYSDTGADQDGFAVEPGKEYRFAAKMFKGAAPQDVGPIQVIAYFAPFANVQSASVVSITSASLTSTPQLVTGSFIAPAGATRCWLYFYLSTMQPATTFYFTDVFCNEKASGDLIVDGAISTVKLAADSVDAGKIQANAVTAAKVAAGEINVGHLKVTGQGSNLLSDGDGRDLTGWQYHTGGSPDSASPTGYYVYQSGNVQNEFWSSVLTPIDVTRNHELRMTVRNITGTSTAYLAVRFFDATGAEIYGSGGLGWPAAGTYLYFGVIGGALTGTWTEHRISFGPGETAKIPSNARFIKVGMLTNYANQAGSVQGLTGVRLFQKQDANLIVDGAILANHLSAGSVSAGAIAAGAIRTEHLFVGSQSGNLVGNGTAIEGISGWAANGAGVLYSYAANWGEAGAQSGFSLNKVLTTDSALAISRAFSVRPGRTYVLRFRSFSNGTGSAGVYHRIGYSNTAPDSQGFIAVTSEPPIGFENGYTTGAYTTYQYTFTAPASVSWASVRLFSWINGPTALYFSEVEVVEQTRSVQIYDGAVVAAKIATDAVEANAIKAGAVTAAKISVTNLAAINADMGTITAGTIQNSGATHVYAVSTGVRRTVLGSYRFMDGPGFGASSNLIMWFGAHAVGLGSETIANSIWAMANDGVVYYGATALGSPVNIVPSRAWAHVTGSNSVVTSGNTVIVPDGTGIVRVPVEYTLTHDGTGSTVSMSVQVEYSSTGTSGWSAVGSPIIASVTSVSTDIQASGAVVKTGLTAGQAAYFRVVATPTGGANLSTCDGVFSLMLA